MTSVVKRGRDLLAPSPITEEEEGSWAGVAGPRRLSYSSEVYCHGTVRSIRICCSPVSSMCTVSSMIADLERLTEAILCLDLEMIAHVSHVCVHMHNKCKSDECPGPNGLHAQSSWRQ